MQPLVCFIEDDLLVTESIIECCQELEFQRAFDIEFVISEQQFWDEVVNDDPSNSIEDRQSLGARRLYRRCSNRFPDFFVVDMMLTWQSRYFRSDRAKNSEWSIDRAGLRMHKWFGEKYQLAGERPWICWTAIDCEALKTQDATLASCLHYKDDGVEEMLKLVKKKLR